MATSPKTSSGLLNVFVKLPAGISYDLEGIPNPIKFNGYHGGDVLETENGVFGVTRNVNAEIFERIKTEHGQSALFQGGFIFARDAAEDGASVKDQAKDHGKAKTGFEPVKPEKTEDSGKA